MSPILNEIREDNLEEAVISSIKRKLEIKQEQEKEKNIRED